MTVQRWTDEMLDNLAYSTTELREGLADVRVSITEMREGMTEMRVSITEMREGMTEMRESIAEMREGMTEMQESIAEIRDSVDGLRLTSQALLQVAAQSQRDMEAMKERQAESDQRFNVLLEEVRFLIRGKLNE